MYLNVPFVSPNEWHPFTISSATDDMKFGPRIHLVSGEEVAEVPRPRSLPQNIKWRRAFGCFFDYFILIILLFQ